ncbi:hypothetical protein [Leptolinea tardivitalis]|uniref:Uncharacterized protein n=1 Tax=Leptolinea tardivitalis TaxID=229920 RepID=A0A0P6X876_9CHLR|nr:hypothetical protein [Leptolinea tardivitalis]KPL70409.1 hypothetical protein ADM99_14745 [Leptolinea tardivitalis]GAP21978.1 hypothetical protein LTAR_02196 [Leptolinea tardivitalis]
MAEAEPTFIQTLEDLSRQAVQFAREKFGLALDFSMTSLPKLERLLDMAHQSYLAGNVSDQGLERSVQVWGAYLGETMRRNKGGVWKIDRNQTGDRRMFLLTQGVTVYPFEQVRQKITGIQPAMPDRDELPQPDVKPRKGLNPLIFVFIAIGVLLITAAVGGIWYYLDQQKAAAAQAQARTAYEAPFLEFFSEYMGEYNEDLTDVPIAGKVLVIDKVYGRVAALNYKIPEEIRAANPDEVAGIVQQHCFGADIGVYSGEIAYTNRMTCRLSVVDLKKHKVVAAQDFIGRQLIEQVRVDKYGNPIEDPYAGIDQQQMVDWIRARVQ